MIKDWVSQRKLQLGLREGGRGGGGEHYHPSPGRHGSYKPMESRIETRGLGMEARDSVALDISLE